MKISTICRYCGGVVRLEPARKIYGDSTNRLGLANEYIYLCQNCNARVGCHKGTNRPLGNVAMRCCGSSGGRPIRCSTATGKRLA